MTSVWRALGLPPSLLLGRVGSWTAALVPVAHPTMFETGPSADAALPVADDLHMDGDRLDGFWNPAPSYSVADPVVASHSYGIEESPFESGWLLWFLTRPQTKRMMSV